MDAAVLTRYETAARPENLRWDGWVVGQLEKVTCALDELERRVAAWSARVDAGSIAVACALGSSPAQQPSFEPPYEDVDDQP
jgi:hypothetical protein